MQVILTEEEWNAYQKRNIDLAKWTLFLEMISNDLTLRKELATKLEATDETAGNILWDMFNTHVPA